VCMRETCVYVRVVYRMLSCLYSIVSIFYHPHTTHLSQTDKQKRDAALLAARAHGLWHDGLLSALDELSANTFQDGSDRAIVVLKTFHVQLLKGRKMCKEACECLFGV